MLSRVIVAAYRLNMLATSSRYGKVRLALLNCSVGLSGCKAKFAECAYWLGFVGEPTLCCGRLAQRRFRQEAMVS
eukprot:4882524-Pleurochrysis_carterae.AAC.2